MEQKRDRRSSIECVTPAVTRSGKVVKRSLGSNTNLTDPVAAVTQFLGSYAPKPELVVSIPIDQLGTNN